MVPNRLSVKPLSKLASCSWVAKRAFIDNLAEVTDDHCYRAMDSLLDALPEPQESVFFLTLRTSGLGFGPPSPQVNEASRRSAASGLTEQDLASLR